MNKFIYALMLVSFSMTSPCVAASRSGKQVVITSNLKNAHVFIEGRHQGTTPLSISCNSRRPCRVIVQADGYGAQYVDLGVKNRKGHHSQYLTYPWKGMAIGSGAGILTTGIMLGGSIFEGMGGLFLATGAVIGGGSGLLIGSVVATGAFIKDNASQQKTHFPSKIHFNLQESTAIPAGNK